MRSLSFEECFAYFEKCIFCNNPCTIFETNQRLGGVKKIDFNKYDIVGKHISQLKIECPKCYSKILANVIANNSLTEYRINISEQYIYWTNYNKNCLSNIWISYNFNKVRVLYQGDLFYINNYESVFKDYINFVGLEKLKQKIDLYLLYR